MMSLRNEDRELQIKLTKLQIEHEHITSLFIGILALEITVLLALETIFFSLYGNLEASLVRTYIVIDICHDSSSLPHASLFFSKSRKTR